MAETPVVLSIAGYDPSSGAGITADIKTAAAFNCYAVSCMTALTVQSTQGVFAVLPVPPEIVQATLDRLRQDFDIAAVRVGMLGSGSVAKEVAGFLERERLPNVVLDPVLRSSSGTDLIDSDGLDMLRHRLLPLVDVVTPNIDEAAILTKADRLTADAARQAAEPAMRGFAERLHEMGARGVAITGGHLSEPMDYVSLAGAEGRQSKLLASPHLASRSTHGTGCAYATAIACLLARGLDLLEAVTQAHRFVHDAIANAYPLGRGTGPINHLFRFGEHPGDEPRKKASR